jgi:CBS domain-containing protein
MLARELARSFPTVSLDDDALEAARLLADRSLPGLIVIDSSSGRPIAVLPGSQVLRFVVPGYVQDDPALARAFDEQSADALCDALVGRSVRDVLPKPGDRTGIAEVEGDATSIEVAARMSALRSPIVAVMEDGVLVGAITASTLLAHLLDRSSM